jgi:hypothetical protein
VKVYENIRSFVWENSIDKLDSSCNHYEINDIDKIIINKFNRIEDTSKYSFEISFELSATLYLDNKEEIDYTDSFPSSCNMIFRIESNEPSFIAVEQLRVNTENLSL